MKAKTQSRSTLIGPSSSLVEAGCDEAGRGPLAGPVVASAVVLPADLDLGLFAGLNDSKRLTERQREELRPLIMEHAVAWAIAEVSAAEIDKINILNASILAMHRAVSKLSVVPSHLLIDGNRFRPYYTDFDTLEQALEGEGASPPDLSTLIHDEATRIPHTTVVGGDGKYLSIAAASVLAKTYRDDLMRALAVQYPEYGWDVNKGYPTKAHYAALQCCGASPLHRLSFNLKLEE